MAQLFGVIDDAVDGGNSYNTVPLCGKKLPQKILDEETIIFHRDLHTKMLGNSGETW